MNTAYSQTLAAAGGTAPYTWSLASGTLPGGLTLNPAGVLGGTTATNGSYSFTVQVLDSGNLVAAKTFTLTIVAQALTITTLTPMPGGQQGVAYAQALTGAGGIAPYTWSVAGGTLPPGLALSSAGDLAGTPTAQGTFNFTVQLADSTSNTITKALAITIAPPPLVISTAVLADGTVGVAYAQTLAALGGTPPNTWSVTWGNLPGGLGLSSAGILSGTPTNYGTFSFIIQAADSGGLTAAQIYTLDIANSVPTITVQSYAPGAVTLLITGDAGPNYTVETSTNLLDWVTALTTNAPAMPFSWTDTDPAGQAARFYRAGLEP